MSRAQDNQGKQVALQNISSLVDFLRHYDPFEHMGLEELEFLVKHSRLAFYSAGDELLSPSDGQVRELYIIKQGRVRGERPDNDGGGGEANFELHDGEIFPTGALLSERPTRRTYRAVTDVFCLELEAAAFADLFTRSEPFRDFCMRGISSLLDKVNQQIKVNAAQRIGAGYSLDTTLRELLRRDPVTCSPETSIRTSVKLMHEHKVGSMIITDAERRALGIFTLHDLRRLFAAGESDFEQPLANVMTPDPVSLPSSAYAFDAAVIMANHHFRHVCVVDDNRLVGIVSESDLFALERVSLAHLARTIRQAPSPEYLASLLPQIRRLIDTMLAHGAAAEQINKLITTLNDHTTVRCIELCLQQHGDPGIEFTWIDFGSAGRHEQTLVTDQDNGILFQPPPGMNADAGRERLLPLARRINEALAEVGFPLCKGNIMASNPELCLTEAEWQARFHSMIEGATPQNLLRSSIYFDLRPIWGPLEPAQRLFEKVVTEAAANKIFQHMMAANALRNRPPLGVIRDFVTQNDRLDLKVQGLTPFVDGARILALANGITATATLDRFAALAERKIINAKDARAWHGAFSFIQILRMRLHQDQAGKGETMSNKLDPDSLDPLDRRILKESFRQARQLHRRLEIAFQVRL